MKVLLGGSDLSIRRASSSFQGNGRLVNEAAEVGSHWNATQYRGPDAVILGFRASERVVGERDEQDIRRRSGPHMTGLK